MEIERSRANFTSATTEIITEEDRPYDVFLAFAGPDREVGRALTSELQYLGLQVFFDENSIPYFTSITKGIARGLQNSKALLVYYSEHFTDRPACQLELTAAFLAGQRQGDPARRVIVINPETTSDHLFPVELRAEPYILQPTEPTANLRAMAQAVKERTAAIANTMGDDAVLVPRPRLYGRMIFGKLWGSRYPESWNVHSALTAPGARTENAYGPTVSLVGSRGMGKTALAALYATQFSAAYSGGIYWTSLERRHSQYKMIQSYVRQCANIRQFVSFPVDDAPTQDHDQFLSLMADDIAAKKEPSLWIIDGVPDQFDPRLLDKLLLPHPRIHNLLLGRQAILHSGLPVVEIGPLTRHNARKLLASYRPPDDAAELVALDRLIDHVGGNPGALVSAGRRLRDRQGLLSYAEYLEQTFASGT